MTTSQDWQSVRKSVVLFLVMLFCACAALGTLVLFPGLPSHLEWQDELVSTGVRKKPTSFLITHCKHWSV